jgi:AcrR family transcriptional regulator
VPKAVPAAAVPSLQARKQQVVRDAIWDAAMDLFAENGFDETTVDQIAEAAGVSRRSFFRYFASKNDLMAQGIVDYAGSLAEAIESCPESYSAAEVLRVTVLRVAQASAAHPRTRKIMQVAARYPAAREAQLSRLAELQDRVEEAFARRYRRAHGHDRTSAVLAGLTLSVLGMTFRLWFEQQGEPDISRTANDVFAAIGRLIGAPPKPKS